jgi:hypothetical protein
VTSFRQIYNVLRCHFCSFIDLSEKEKLFSDLSESLKFGLLDVVRSEKKALKEII